MMPTLQLRDVHLGAAPPWWPPAPGWWLLLAAISLVVGLLALRGARQRRRRDAILQLFDDAVTAAATPPQQVAAMSELLRRAARRVHPGADTLEPDAWLRVLDDGMPHPVFGAGAGALLRDGVYRADVTAQEAEALRMVARERYLLWMQSK